MKKISSISKRALKQFYVDRDLSITNIAKKYDCNPVTIYNRLKEYSIKIKNRSEAHTMSSKYDFSGNVLEKAYLTGFRLGDLHVRKFSKNGKILNVSCGSSNINQIKLIEQLFSKYCKVYISKKDKRGIIRIEANLNNSFNFLLEKEKHVNKEFLKSKKTFFSFLAGYVDAEGNIKTHKQGFSVFRIRTYDKQILQDIKTQLEKHNYQNIKLNLFSEKIPGKQNNDYWGVCIYKKSQLLKLYKDLLPFIKHKNKKTDILNGIKNITDRNNKYGHLRMSEEQNV